MRVIRLSITGAALAVLSSCAPHVVPTDTSASVSLYAGGTFHGSSETVLFPDDVEQVSIREPFSDKAKVRTRQLKPGAFIAARDHVLAFEPPKRPEKVLEECLDYGVDSVSYEGPDRQVNYASDCPDAAITGLMAGVGEIIDAHDPEARNPE